MLGVETPESVGGSPSPCEAHVLGGSHNELTSCFGASWWLWKDPLEVKGLDRSCGLLCGALILIRGKCDEMCKKSTLTLPTSTFCVYVLTSGLTHNGLNCTDLLE